MTETKFTPGPWVVKPHSHSVWEKAKLHKVRDGIICNLSIAYKSSEECAANAHLVAAAPELYEAVAAATNALRSYQYGNGSPELAEQVADSCARALAKARGETGD